MRHPRPRDLAHGPRLHQDLPWRTKGEAPLALKPLFFTAQLVLQYNQEMVNLAYIRRHVYSSLAETKRRKSLAEGLSLDDPAVKLSLLQKEQDIQTLTRKKPSSWRRR